jgi:hypothetical protein
MLSEDGVMVDQETTVGMEEDDRDVRTLMRVQCRLGRSIGDKCFVYQRAFLKWMSRGRKS